MSPAKILLVLEVSYRSLRKPRILLVPLRLASHRSSASISRARMRSRFRVGSGAPAEEQVFPDQTIQALRQESACFAQRVRERREPVRMRRQETTPQTAKPARRPQGSRTTQQRVRAYRETRGSANKLWVTLDIRTSGPIDHKLIIASVLPNKTSPTGSPRTSLDVPSRF